MEKVILDYQLFTHYKFLEPLKALFRHSDPLNNGYINLYQFNQLMNKVDPEIQFDRDELVDRLNCHESKRVTFNEVVQAFSGQFVEKDNDEVNLLQFIYLGE